MLSGAYILNPAEWNKIYGPDEHRDISQLVNLVSDPISPTQALQSPELLHDVEVLFSGWGGPKLNKEFLDLMPDLQVIFYGAGGIGYMVTDEFWERGIPMTTSNNINAIPVSEYTLGCILLSLKSFWKQVRVTHDLRRFLLPQLPVAGAYGSTVGLISLGAIGRLVVQRLASHQVNVIAYDPFLTKRDAAKFDVELVSLDEVFRHSDVVSLHTPLKDDTIGMVMGRHISCMKENATFINTSRGGVVRELEMIEALRRRPDLTAILDVTEPEPPLPTCELFDLPNVVLSPHIAGSLDRECHRMGRWMVDELKRFLTGQPMLGVVEAPSNSKAVAV